nr:DUF5711 family protein [Sedimentibacter sp.]
MKKFLLFLFIMVIIFGLSFWFAGGKKIISSFDNNKTYKFTEQKINDINTLDDCRLFSNGILTYNNKKITYMDYENNPIWMNENRVFMENVFVSGDYIYKCLENGIEILDKDNHNYVIAEIQGEVLNVSRENNSAFIITKQNSGKNSLYILNENNEVVLENKQYNDSITGVALNDKSDSYCISTIKYIDGEIKNTLSYNLIDDMELWNKTIDGEVIIKIKIVDNSILVLGTGNIYCFNLNGSLMWKNSNYNRIKDFQISNKGKKIYILYEQDEKIELLGYNFEGKVKEIYKLPKNIEKFKIFDDKIYVYDEHSVNLLHDNIVDKLFEKLDSQIIDFDVINNNLHILLKDELVSGKIK